MATEQVSSAGLSAESRIYYEKTMLYVAVPKLIHGKYGRQERIPKRTGSTVQWRRYELLAPALTPLTEGITPPGNTLTIDQVTVSVSQYGDYVTFSDVVDVVSIDPLLESNSKVMGQQAGNTADIVTRNVITAGTNVQFANNRTSRTQVQQGDVVTDTELKKLRRALARQNVLPCAGQYYCCIHHPDTTFDIQNTNAWALPAAYQNQSQYEDGRISPLYGLMFQETTNAQVFVGAGSGGINVYATVSFGQEAFATVDIEGLQLETIYKSLGSAGTDDALNQRQSQGWKMTHAAAILNQNYLVRLEHATTA